MLIQKKFPALLTATGPNVHQALPVVHQPRRQRDCPRHPSHCTQPPHFPASLGVQEGVIITIHPPIIFSNLVEPEQIDFDLHHMGSITIRSILCHSIKS